MRTVMFSVQSTLAKYYVQQKMPEVGIFYGKQAVNTMQQLRQGNRALDRDLQRSLLEKNQRIYQQLADWLITAGLGMGAVSNVHEELTPSDACCVQAASRWRWPRPSFLERTE